MSNKQSKFIGVKTAVIKIIESATYRKAESDFEVMYDSVVTAGINGSVENVWQCINALLKIMDRAKATGRKSNLDFAYLLKVLGGLEMDLILKKNIKFKRR